MHCTNLQYPAFLGIWKPIVYYFLYILVEIAEQIINFSEYSQNHKMDRDGRDHWRLSARADYSGFCPGGFLIFLEKETPKPLWSACHSHSDILKRKFLYSSFCLFVILLLGTSKQSLPPSSWHWPLTLVCGLHDTCLHWQEPLSVSFS